LGHELGQVQLADDLLAELLLEVAEGADVDDVDRPGVGRHVAEVARGTGRHAQQGDAEGGETESQAHGVVSGFRTSRAPGNGLWRRGPFIYSLDGPGRSA